MYKTLVTVLFFCAFFAGKTADAAMADYKQEFEINLEEDTLPSMAELEEIFNRENRYYDKKYHTFWDLTGEFDPDFYARAATYGINEKRLKWEEEEHTLEILAALPKEMYPYIGPMLFEIPNMSEKVLNMPGIKETKNQFPKRIAPQLKDVEDIEPQEMPQVVQPATTKRRVTKKAKQQPALIQKPRTSRSLNQEKVLDEAPKVDDLPAAKEKEVVNTVEVPEAPSERLEDDCVTLINDIESLPPKPTRRRRSRRRSASSPGRRRSDRASPSPP